MRVAQVCLSLWKRPVGEPCESARARRELQRDAVTVPDEERELVAAKHACPAGVAASAGHHERPHDQVPRARERPGKVRKRRSRAIFDNAPRRPRRRSAEGDVHVSTNRRRGHTRDHHHDARKRHSGKVQPGRRRCNNLYSDRAMRQGHSACVVRANDAGPCGTGAPPPLWLWAADDDQTFAQKPPDDLEHVSGQSGNCSDLRTMSDREGRACGLSREAVFGCGVPLSEAQRLGKDFPVDCALTSSAH